MSALDLSSKTVLELRKIAKDQGVKLGAGISKAGIIAKLEEAMNGQSDPEMTKAAEAPADQALAAAPAAEADAEEAPEAPAPAAPKAPEAAQQPQFRAAWHNPAPRYGAKPAYQAPAYNNAPRQPGYARPAAPMNDAPRTAQTRPTGYTPRFGPSAAPSAAPQEAPRQEEEFRPAYRAEPAPRPAYAPERRPYGGEARPAYGENRGYERPAYEDRPQRPAYESQGYDNGYNRAPRPAYQAPRRDFAPEQSMPNPAVSEMLAAGECLDGAGVLEMHPDGYGFLRGESFLPSSKDIYVSVAQIRRFSLRTGDYVEGKTRPMRDGDKYAALLYITQVNGLSPEEAADRPLFEELTPVYPSRRINLEDHDQPHRALRLIDLIAPLGFGQRALLLCPPETGKTELMQSFANVIARNHPETTVMALLLDETPEDVTAFRDAVSCTVLASTFDQPPENHLRLAEVVQSRAERLVEQGKDVVLLVDSLTRLAKVYTTAAQQGRSTPGLVNPSSLFRAKKLFGSARCMKEGGSLTIIAAMNIETGSRVDDSVVEEFKGTANMELLLDASIARAGVHPAINLPMSGTKRAEALLDRSQMEGLQLIRSIMASTRSVTAIPQLLSMLEMASTNDELLVKIKDWTQLMNK